MILVIEELAEIAGAGLLQEVLDAIGFDGMAHGISLLAATTRPEILDEEVLAHFATRLVLQLTSPDQSIELIGSEEAVDLDPAGALLLRIEGREPVSLRGFRMSDAHVEQFISVLHEAYGAAPLPAVVAPVPVPGPATGNETGFVNAGEEVSGSGGEKVPERSTEHGGDGEHTPLAMVPFTASARDDVDTTPQAEPEEGPSVAIRAWLEGLPGGVAGGAGDADTVEQVEDGAEGNADRSSGYAGASTTARSVDTEATPPDAEDALYALVAGTPRTTPGGAAVAPEGSLLQVRCFGRLRVFHGDRELTPQGEDARRGRPWEALAYLAARPDGTARRDRMLSDMWPKVPDPAVAANRLDTNLARVRSVLSYQVPEVTRDVITSDRSGWCNLDTSVVWSDVREFVALIRRAVKAPALEAMTLYTRACALYGGDLLSSSGYDWVYELDDDGFVPQDRYRELYLQAANALARLYREDRQTQRAVAVYRNLLRAEPTCEDVIRSLYTCYGEMGDRSALIRAHRQLRQALRDAYDRMDPADVRPEDREPEPETVRVYEEVFGILQRQEAERGASQETGVASVRVAA